MYRLIWNISLYPLQLGMSPLTLGRVDLPLETRVGQGFQHHGKIVEFWKMVLTPKKSWNLKYCDPSLVIFIPYRACPWRGNMEKILSFQGVFEFKKTDSYWGRYGQKRPRRHIFKMIWCFGTFGPQSFYFLVGSVWLLLAVQKIKCACDPVWSSLKPKLWQISPSLPQRNKRLTFEQGQGWRIIIFLGVSKTKGSVEKYEQCVKNIACPWQV